MGKSGFGPVPKERRLGPYTSDRIRSKELQHIYRGSFFKELKRKIPIVVKEGLRTNLVFTVLSKSMRTMIP